eukprot:7311571-Ditylum_brightwellii.AAC.1
MSTTLDTIMTQNNEMIKEKTKEMKVMFNSIMEKLNQQSNKQNNVNKKLNSPEKSSAQGNSSTAVSPKPQNNARFSRGHR